MTGRRPPWHWPVAAVVGLGFALAATWATAAAGAALPTAVERAASAPISPDLRGRITAELGRRTAELQALQAQTAASTDLTGAHKDALQGLFAADLAGMAGLQGQLAAASTHGEAMAIAGSMVKDWRVFTVVAPKVPVTAACDRVSALVPGAQDLLTRVGTRLAELRAAGVDISGPQTAVVDAQHALADAAAKATDCAATALGVIPTEPLWHPFAQLRTDLSAIVADLLVVHATIGTVRPFLAQHS